MRRQPTVVHFDSSAESRNRVSLTAQDVERNRPGKGAILRKPLEIHVDGPFGAPASDIFRAEHAVLIGTGIGVTPFASILQVTRIATFEALLNKSIHFSLNSLFILIISLLKWCYIYLQSIMHRYWQMKRQCPGCDHKWSEDMETMLNLRKVDFFWINRDQKSFEWFVNLLSALEIEQAEEAGTMGHFLEMHM